MYAQQPLVREALAAASAAETARVPVPSQGPNQAAGDSLVAMGARRHEEHAEVVLAVVAAPELIVDVPGKPLETLRAYKTFRVPDLATGIDDLLRRAEPVAALAARHHVKHGQHGDSGGAVRGRHGILEWCQVYGRRRRRQRWRFLFPAAALSRGAAICVDAFRRCRHVCVVPARIRRRVRRRLQ